MDVHTRRNDLQTPAQQISHFPLSLHAEPDDEYVYKQGWRYTLEMREDMAQSLNLKSDETKRDVERGVTPYWLNDPDGEVQKRAKALELRRREAIEKLGDRWAGKPVQQKQRD